MPAQQSDAARSAAALTLPQCAFDPDQVQPGFVDGVQFVATGSASVQIVGDIDSPMSLEGADEHCLQWLRQVDGQRSWRAQVWYAEALGIPRQIADEVLRKLDGAGLLVDQAIAATDPTDSEVSLIGHHALSDAVKSLVRLGSTLGAVPGPRDGADWVDRSRDLIAEIGVGPVVLVLRTPRPDAAEVVFASALVAAGIQHLVIGAGTATARVGPYTVPGAGGCLRCEELVGIDVDGVWREIGAAASLTDSTDAAQSSVLLALCAAEAARQLVAIEMGYRASSRDAVLQSGYRGGAWRRRPMVRHQRCSCWWPRSQ